MQLPHSRILMTTILLLASGGAPAGLAQGIDIDELGPQVGDRVPDFTLPDQYGKEHSLESLLGPDALVLVFIRSADW